MAESALVDCHIAFQVINIKDLYIGIESCYSGFDSFYLDVESEKAQVSS